MKRNAYIPKGSTLPKRHCCVHYTTVKQHGSQKTPTYWCNIYSAFFPNHSANAVSTHSHNVHSNTGGGWGDS